MANRKDSKGRKLKEGESERKDGRYVYRYINKKTGKRQSVYARDLAELRRKEKEIDLDVYNNITTDSEAKKLTVNDLFERYLEVHEVSDSTKVNYCTAWNNHVKDCIGEYKVVSLLPSDIKKFYARMSKDGYSHSMIKIVHNLLHPVLEMAVDDDIIRKNPTKGTLGDYGKEPKEKKALTAVQQKKLMEFVKSDNTYNVYFPMLTIMLETGVRCGELCGLTMSDINMEKREISINKTLIYKNFGDGLKLHVSTPKTASGIRTIPMTDNVFNAFNSLMELNMLLGKNGSKCTVDGYSGFIFLTRNNNVLLMSSVNKILANIIKTYNIANPSDRLPNISAHTMRHTFCTRCAENGLDIKALQYIMGHASINITMEVYNHIADMSRITRELSKMNTLAMNL